MRKALLNARIERNLTQEEVAQKAGISRSAYTNIERLSLIHISEPTRP